MAGCNCEEFLLSRRSIRVFEPREVPLDLVLRAIEVARFAPSAKNAQPWEFIVVNDRDLMERLSKIHANAKPLERCQVAIVVVSDREKSPVSYLVDGAIAATYLWLALHCLGLGAVWIQTLRDVDRIRDLLNIPERLIPVAILAVGWPGERPTPKGRRAVEELVHLNSYGVRIKEVRGQGG